MRLSPGCSCCGPDWNCANCMPFFESVQVDFSGDFTHSCVGEPASGAGFPFPSVDECDNDEGPDFCNAFPQSYILDKQSNTAWGDIHSWFQGFVGCGPGSAFAGSQIPVPEQCTPISEECYIESLGNGIFFGSGSYGEMAKCGHFTGTTGSGPCTGNVLFQRHLAVARGGYCNWMVATVTNWIIRYDRFCWHPCYGDTNLLGSGVQYDLWESTPPELPFESEGCLTPVVCNHICVRWLGPSNQIFCDTPPTSVTLTFI